jgi:hypothetical protein
LSVLAKVKAKRGESIYTKSGLMLGLGETETELLEAMTDLRQVGCRSDSRPIFTAHAQTPAGCGVCEAGQICRDGRPRSSHGLNPRRERSNGPKLLPRRRI